MRLVKNKGRGPSMKPVFSCDDGWMQMTDKCYKPCKPGYYKTGEMCISEPIVRKDIILPTLKDNVSKTVKAVKSLISKKHNLGSIK